MSSLLRTRKMAGSGNFFVAFETCSTFDSTGAATTPSTDASGTVYADLGERVRVGDDVLARVVPLDGQQMPVYVYVNVADGSTNAISVSHVGAGTRN